MLNEIALLGLMLISGSSDQKADVANGISHGTVNVILANQNGAVVVTDSRLTFIDPGKSDHVVDGYSKLFKINDREVCSMAGLYSGAGPIKMSNLTAIIPEFMRDYAVRRQVQTVDFISGVNNLLNEVRHKLTAWAQDHLSVEGDLSFFRGMQPLELTLVGYDLDGSLKVAEITLVPSRPTPTSLAFTSIKRPPMTLPKGMVVPNPPCKSDSISQDIPARFPEDGVFTVYTIGKGFFCDVAGLPFIAMSMLDSPAEDSRLPAMRAYASARKSGEELTLKQLSELAIELERQSAKDESSTANEFGVNGYEGVGGSPQIAFVRQGSVSGNFFPWVEGNSGVELNGSDMSTTKPIDCSRRLSNEYAVYSPSSSGNGALLVFTRPGTHLNANLVNCYQTLDSLVFYDSSFNNSELHYNGTGSLIFGRENRIINSTLDLGPKVNLDDGEVRKLMCRFPWKSIRQGDVDLADRCVKGFSSDSRPNNP